MKLDEPFFSTAVSDQARRLVDPGRARCTPMPVDPVRSLVRIPRPTGGPGVPDPSPRTTTDKISCQRSPIGQASATGCGAVCPAGRVDGRAVPRVAAAGSSRVVWSKRPPGSPGKGSASRPGPGMTCAARGRAAAMTATPEPPPSTPALRTRAGLERHRWVAGARRARPMRARRAPRAQSAAAPHGARIRPGSNGPFRAQRGAPRVRGRARRAQLMGSGP